MSTSTVTHHMPHASEDVIETCTCGAHFGAPGDFHIQSVKLAHLRAHGAEFISTDETVAAMKLEILHDIIAGTVPTEVSTYSQLHDYVDANEYGTDAAFDTLVDTDEWDGVVEHLNRCQNIVDAWLKDGRPVDNAKAVVDTLTPAQIKATADGTAPRASKHDSHNAAVWNAAIDSENGYV